MGKVGRGLTTNGHEISRMGRDAGMGEEGGEVGGGGCLQGEFWGD